MNTMTVILCALLSLFPPVLAATPQIQILTPDNVRITEEAGCAVIRVAFSFRVRYVKHFPFASGDDLRIQFEPLGVSPADREVLFRRRSVRPPRSQIASLVEVVYEGDVQGGPFLTLFFARPRVFSVNQGADFRSLIIVVRGDEVVGECPPVR